MRFIPKKRKKMVHLMNLMFGMGFMIGFSYSTPLCWNKIDQGKYSLVDNQKLCIQRENIPKDAQWL